MNQSCKYCNSRKGLIQCECGTYFCNGKIINNSKCQIIYHMIENDHFSVIIEGKQLKCKNCEETNIFNLRYKNNSKDFICCNCLTNENDKNKKEYHKQIVEEYKFILSNYEIDHSNVTIDMKTIDEIERKIEKHQQLNIRVKSAIIIKKLICNK